MSDIKIIALGGVRENAKNLYIVEINDSIFILDAGLKYPENEQLGVDFVIPNLDYLIENRDLARSQSTSLWIIPHNRVS